MTTLDAALLEAHVADDKSTLVQLYTTAADIATDLDAEMFFLTHAHVFALEIGDHREAALRARMKAAGRID